MSTNALKEDYLEVSISAYICVEFILFYFLAETMKK